MLTNPKDENPTGTTEKQQLSKPLDDHAAAVTEIQENVLSFLGVGHDIPPVPDGVEPPLSSQTQDDLSHSAPKPVLQSTTSVAQLPALVPFRPTSPPTSDRAENAAQFIRNRSVSPVSTPDVEKRRLSAWQTSDHIPTPPAVASPTAIPLHFRTPRASVGFTRSSPSSPAVAPESPSSFVHRTRQARPGSTEFKSSTEFRPLWLVERHKSRQDFEPDEPYPSLPSSRTTSRSSSAHDTEGKDTVTLNPDYDTIPNDFGLGINVEHDLNHAEFLDSQQPTPVAISFPSAVQHDADPGDELSRVLDFEHHCDMQTNQPENPIYAPSSSPTPSPAIVDGRLPDHRSASPSRNHAGDFQNLPPLPPSRASSPDGEYDELLSSSAITDAAIAMGGLVGGAAAVVLGHKRNNEKVSSPSRAADDIRSDEGLAAPLDTARRQCMEHKPTTEGDFMQSDKPMEKDNTQSEFSMASASDKGVTTGDELLGPINKSPDAGLLSVEQQRQLQEQDAQDAVDTWFSPATSKTSRKEKKGKKKKASTMAQDLDRSAAETSHTTPSLEITRVAPLTAVEPLIEEYHYPALPEGPTGRRRNQEGQNGTTVLPSKPVITKAEGVDQAVPARQIVEAEDEWHSFSVKSKKSKSKKRKKQDRWDNEPVEPAPADVEQGPETTSTTSCDEPIADLHPAEAPNDLHLAEEPRAFEETDVTPKDDIPTPEPPSSRLEAESVPEPALPVEKAKKDRKKAKEASRPGPFMEVAEEQTSSALEADSEEDPSPSTQSGGNEIEIGPALPKHTHVADVSSIVGSITECVMQGKRKGKGKMRQKLDLWNEPEPMSMDMDPTTVETSERQPEPEPPSMDPVHLTEAEFSQEPEPASSDLGHTIAENTVQKLKPVSSLEPALEAVAAFEAFVPAAEQKSVPELESETDLSFPPKKKKSKKGKKTMQLHEVSSLAPAKPIEDMRQAKASDDKQQEVPSPNSAYPLPETPGAFPVEQNLRTIPSPDTIPLPKDADLGLYHPSDDDQLQKEANFVDTMHSLRAENNDDLRQENTLPTSAALVTEPSGAFSTEQSLSRSPSPETVPLREDSDLDLHAPSNDDQLQQEAIASGGKLDGTLPSSESPSEERMQHETGVLPSLKNIISGVLAPVQKEQHPLRPPSPDRIPLPQDSHLDLDDSLNDDQLRHNVTDSDSNLDVAVPSIESVGEGGMQQGTTIIPTSIDPESEFSESVRTEQNLARTPSPVLIPLPDDVDPEAPSTHLIPLPENAESEFPSPERVPLPEDVDLDIKLPKSAPLADDANLKSSPPEVIRVADDADLALHELLPNTVPLPIEHDRDLRQGSTTTVRESAPSTLGRSQPLMEKATHGPDHSPTSPSHMEDKMKDKLSIPTVPVLSYELPEDHLPLDAAVAESTAVASAEDTDGYLGFSTSGKGPEGTTRERSERSEPSTPNIEPDLQEFKSSDVTTEAHERTTSAIPHQDTLSEPPEDAAIGDMDASAKKKGKKAKKQKLPLPYLEGVLPMLRGSRGTSSTHEIDLQAPLKDTLVESSEPSSTSTSLHPANEQQHPQEADVIAQSKEQNELEMPTFTKRGKKKRKNEKEPFSPEVQTTLSTPGSLNIPSSTPGDFVGSTIGVPEATEASQPSGIISREVQSYPSTPLEGPSDKLGHAIQDFFSISTKKKGKNGKKNKQSQDDDSGSATPERPMAPAQSEPLLAEKDDIVKGEEEIKVKEFKRDKKDKKKGKSDTTAGPKDLAAFVVNEDGAATPPSIPMEGPATAEDQQPTTAIERHESLPDIRPGPSFRDDFLETSSVSHFEGTIVPDGLGETDIIDESHPNTSNEDHLREAIEFSLPLDDPADFPVEVQEEVQEVEPEVDNQEQFFSLKKSKKEKKKAKKAKVAIQEDVPFTTLERSAADIRSKPFDVQTESLEGTYDESPLTLSAEERVQVPEPPSVLDRPFDEPHVSKSSKENATAAVEAEESLLAPAEVDNGIDLNLSPVVKLDASGKGQPRMLEEPAFMETTGEQPSEDLIEPYNAHPPLSDDTRGSFTFQPSLDANTEEVGEGLTAVNKGDVVVNAESPVFNEEPTAVNEMPAASNKNPTVVDEELTEVEDGTVAVAEEPVTVRGQETAGPGNSQAEENLWGIPTRKEARKSKKQQKEILLPSLAKKPRETASNVREQYDGPSTLIVPARDAEASNKMDLGEATSRGTSTEDSEVKGTKAQDPERDDWLEASKIEGNGYEETLSRSLAEPTQLEDINDIKNLGGPDSWKPSLEHRPTMQAEGRDSQQDEWLEGFTSKKKGKKGKNQRHDGHFPLETDVKGDYGAEVLTAAANPRADPGESTERPVSKDLRAPMPTGDAMVPLGGSPFESVVEDSIKPPQSDDFWSSTLAKKGKKGKKSKKQQPAVEWEDETVGSRAGMFAEVTAGRYEPPEVRVLQDKTITSIEESASPGQALQDTPGMAPINPTDEIERASKEAGSDSVWGLAPTKKGKKGKESSKQSRSLEEVATPTSSKYSDGSPGHANLARDVAEQDTIGLRQSKDRRSADEVMVEDLPALPPSRPESPVVRLAERVQPKDERPKNETTLEHLAALPPSRPDFPGVGPGPAEALTQTSTKDGHLREETVLEDLAAIPASRSNSPIARPSRVLAQTQIRDERSKDKILFEDLPTLPPSKPASPVVRPVEAVAQTQTRDGGSKDETMVEEMPPLPPTRLESPLVRPTGTLTQTRSKDGRPKITTRLQDLSAFQSSNPQLPVAGPAERVQSKDEHSQDWIKLEVVPALPPSRPDSPVARSAEALALVQEDVISANPNEHLTRDEVMVESLHGQDRSKTEGAEAYLLTQASTPGEDPYNIRAFKAPTALAAGLGLAVAETLQRQTTKQDSKKGAKKKKKQKKNFDWTEHEEEEPTQLTVMNADQIVEPPRDRSGSPSNFSDFHTLETEQLRQVQVGSEYPSDLATPMVSRSDHFPEQGVSTLPHLNRDSAVHVSDSPLLLQTLPGYNPGRDSGYQDTMASPVVHSKQNSSAASEVQSPLGDDFERFTSQKPLLTKPASVPGPMPRSNDHPASIDSRQQADANTGSSHPLKVSVELDPAYELSVSRHRTRKPGSPMGSGRSVDIHWEQPGSPNEPSEPSGLEHLIDHSRNLNSVPRSREDLRQPPPVESATKDRSSVLFHSSPSTREETTYHPAVHPTREYLHEPKLQESQIAHVEAAESTARGLESSGLRQASHDLPSPTTIATERASSLAALSGTLDIHQAPHLSLFGGPVGTNSDSPSVKSPPPASLSFTGSERRPLDTITEYSPEESPLNKKNRAFSDVGSPERRIKSVYRSVTPQSLGPNHLRSPAVQTSGLGSTPHSRTSAAEKSPISTDDFIARLSWPAVDEDNHSVDLERVLSRNTDRRPSSRHSNSSTRLREGDVRSTSGQSFRSGGSINRFRTPDRDHVRPASGVGNRSATATPPLRRVDRSLSGDLRAANKRSEAKSLAKQPDLGFDPHVPSSSTYDPIKDKGKSIARDDMTDVYVSHSFFACEISSWV